MYVQLAYIYYADMVDSGFRNMGKTEAHYLRKQRFGNNCI